jgi:predicted dehydrogenase
MRIAIVGCGYVSTFYGRTIPNWPQLEVVGVYDQVPEYAASYCRCFGTTQYKTYAEVLSDPRVDAIVNLTNPRAHYDVSKAALLAGKHVYSEKPLATDLDNAVELVSIAKHKGLQLSSAPCNLLGETAQTVWKALREQMIGKVRLVYAELDDGLVHRLDYAKWQNEIGRPWPYKDEFEVGCTLEHAGYYVSWLIAFFGSVKRITTFPRCLINDKQTQVAVEVVQPDFSCACLEFESGVVARLTCGIVAPHDHQLRIFGDEGTLSVDDCWYYDSPVHFEPFSKMSPRLKRLPFAARLRGVHRRSLP